MRQRSLRKVDHEMLALNHITKSYPGVLALDDVSLSFKKGEIHAIVGENGAGKSTLIKIIAGAITPDKGEMILGSLSYGKTTPQEAIANGIAVIYQEFNLFESLTAAENIFIGEKGGTRALVDFKRMNEEAGSIFRRFGVDIRPDMLVRELSPGQKQIVEIAKALHKHAKIIIMDEPTAPLSMAEVDRFFAIIHELRATGITILYISHRLEEIFTIADRVSVLRDGQYITTKQVKETNRKDLIGLMVGRELKNAYPGPGSTLGGMRGDNPGQAMGKPALEIRNLSGNGVKDIHFHVNKGEILGMAGLVGSGRTELIRVIFGAEKLEKGEILVGGKPVRLRSPAKALANGIGLIPEDRKQQGAFLQMTITWNNSISNVRDLSHWLVVNRTAESAQARTYQKLLNIKTPSLEQKVLHLSGGNQQKVVLAKVMAARTDILIFDEPTRGIDVGAREEIYQLMRTLADEGKAILMVSSDMEELLGMSDRIVVLSEGRVAGELQKSEFDQQHVLELASIKNSRR
jgi:ribose transport system ATP-binding protein